MIVPGVVLSGGASSRMGRPKALVEIAGETFLARAVRVLREGGADDVIVVTGEHDAEVRRAIEATAVLRDVRVAFNPDHARGQLSSLHTALSAIDHPGVSAMIVTLVDHPLVRPQTVRALLAAWRATHAPLVRPVFGGRHGHPVVFDRSVFDAIRRAPLDGGARFVVRELGTRVVDVPTGDEGVCLDVDTPEDLARAVERARGQAGR